MAYDLTAGATCATFIASGDLSAKQYRFVKMSANNTVAICTAITDVPVGVLQNKPTAGQAAVVCISGISKLESGATLAAGAICGTATDAQAQAAVATQYPVALVLEGSAADEILTAMISPALIVI